MEDIKESRFRRFIRRSLVYEVNPNECICETLREIYDLVEPLPDKVLKDKITNKLIEAFAMGKKMSARLIYYKTTYKDTTGHGGENLKMLPHKSRVRRMRRARPFV